MIAHIILVLGNLAPKIIPLVPNLRETPVGVPSKVMMTMTTSTTDPTSHRRSPTPLVSDTSSFTLKELLEQNSGIRGCDDDCFYPSKILREIPTSKFTSPNATAVVDPLDDDDDDQILIANAQEDTISAPTFLQEWEAGYRAFKNSNIYDLAHSSAANLSPSLVDDADADEDRKIHERDVSTLPTNSNFGLRRLRHSVRNLEKLNIQFAKFVESLETHAPYQPTLGPIDNNPPHPPPCSETQRDNSPQHDPTMAPPPALTPAANSSTEPLATPGPRQPTLCTTANNLPTQLCFEPQCGVRPTVPPPAPNPLTCPPPECRIQPWNDRSPCRVDGPTPSSSDRAPTTVLGERQSTPPTAKPTIPNWARPAVPPAVSSPMEGVICTGKPPWPPPRPARKTIPFKKKSQTKPAADNQKDFLRPP